jgi:hypothetical protein
MHWIYILKCDDGYYYVGETKRLRRRFYEHSSGEGGVNTRTYEPISIDAIYQMAVLHQFIDYNNHVNDCLNNNNTFNNNLFKYFKDSFNNKDDTCDYKHLFVENNITECLMINNKDNYEKIRGGKYTNFNCNYTFPNNDSIKELPLCKCGLPCDVKKKDDEYLYFRCAKKNMWDNMLGDNNDYLEINDEPCNFFKKYTKDTELRLNSEKDFSERKLKISSLMKDAKWLNNVPNCDVKNFNNCVECLKRYSNNLLSYGGIKRKICFNCFLNKFDDLKLKYNKDKFAKRLF